jgi:hypothetical protein
MEGGAVPEPIWIKEENGVAKAVTGLDEYDRAVQELPEDKKKAKIAEIRKEVHEIEKMIFGMAPEPKSPKFWEESKLNPHNVKFFDGERFTIWLSNKVRYIDVADPYDRILKHAIEAGSYNNIAPSLEIAQKNPRKYRWYLDVLETTSASTEENRRIKNRAKTKLEDMRDENPDMLILVARYIDVDPTQYKKSTPVSITYTNMDRFIEGELWEKNKKRAAEQFVEACKLTMEELIIRGLIKVAKAYKFIDAKNDGFIYFMKEGTVLGRNEEEVFLFLKNPVHEDIFKKLQKECDYYLNQ